MLDKNILVFTEVRYRSNKNYGQGLDTINKSKQKKLILAAQTYLQENKLSDTHEARFDVISVDKNNKVTWIKNAFEVEY